MEILLFSYYPTVSIISILCINISNLNTLELTHGLTETKIVKSLKFKPHAIFHILKDIVCI